MNTDMNTKIETGMHVRCSGRAETGTVKAVVDGYATVAFEPRPGTVTVGYFPVTQLEAVTPDKSGAPASISKRKAATVAEVLGAATAPDAGPNGRGHG